MRLFLFIFFLILFAPLYLGGTHIVGGELNYKCLGDDSYEISLTIYRDCYNGNPNAFFDNPASIGIFDRNNQLVTSVGEGGQVLIDFIEDDTIQAGLFGVCEVEPPNVCVHTTTYKDTISLPFLEGGYQLAYQRCCRNQTIQNIVAPLQTGATYYNFISEEALNGCNSSAVFKDWPPIYICANEAIVFDHSALDEDGDLLLYELCAPFTGANQDTPRPQPPNPPVYEEVNWNFPYGLEDMLGGIPLSIDANTGLLTGTPNVQGQFVVGICVKEYRDGKLISTSKRDFQYNVGYCGLTSSAFSSFELECGNLDVVFQNESLNAQSYEWLIGTEESPLLNANNDNLLAFTFPDFGTYPVRLIASNTSGSCIDTFRTELTLLPQTIVPIMEISQVACGDSALIHFESLSFDPNGDITNCVWELSSGIQFNSKDAYLSIAEDSIEIKLTVFSSTGCSTTIEEVFYPKYLNLSLEDTIAICGGGSLRLNEGGDPDLIYEWTPSEGLSATDIYNPELSLTEGSMTYMVAVAFPDGSCSDKREVTVIVPEALEVSIETEQDSCNALASARLIANNNLASVRWALDKEMTTVLGESSVFFIAPNGQNTYYVLAEDEYGCSVLDSVDLTSFAPRVTLDTYDWLCVGSEFTMRVLNSNPNDSMSYYWTPEEVIVEGQGTSEVIIFTESPTTITVRSTNQYGCSIINTQYVAPSEDYVLDLNIIADPDSLYPGESTQLTATLDEDYNYEWEQDSTLSALDIYNPIATIFDSRAYYLTVVDANGCRIRDSIYLFVRDFDCELPYIFIPNAFTPNDDGANDVLYVRGNAVDEMQLMIYNRWGKKVFETRDINMGWDGKLNGKALPPDVFGYYLKLKCLDGRTVIKKGNITLLR